MSKPLKLRDLTCQDWCICLSQRWRNVTACPAVAKLVEVKFYNVGKYINYIKTTLFEIYFFQGRPMNNFVFERDKRIISLTTNVKVSL